MGLIAFTGAMYAAALRKLLPRGRVWPQDPGTNQATVLSALAQTPARVDAAAVNLLSQSLPGNAVQLLPEWEATFGLDGSGATYVARQQLVNARFLASAGQSTPFFMQLAATLGYQISIQFFTPARAGQLCAGQPLGGEGWAFGWKVTVLSGGDPTILEAEFRRLMPAHTVLIFA